eukprot:5089897-Prymnesium_polylepis.1
MLGEVEQEEVAGVASVSRVLDGEVSSCAVASCQKKSCAASDLVRSLEFAPVLLGHVFDPEDVGTIAYYRRAWLVADW